MSRLCLAVGHRRDLPVGIEPPVLRFNDRSLEPDDGPIAERTVGTMTLTDLKPASDSGNPESQEAVVESQEVFLEEFVNRIGSIVIIGDFLLLVA